MTTPDPLVPQETASRFSRRFLLRRTVLGAAAMTVGGAFLGSWQRRAMELPRAALKVLSADQAAVLTAICETFLPPSPGFPTIQEVKLVERLDAKIAQMPVEDSEEVQALLWVMEYGAPVLGPALGRFTALSDAARERYLAGWESSSLEFKRTGFHALKYLVFLFYYDSPKSWKKLKYAGPVLPRMGEEQEM